MDILNKENTTYAKDITKNVNSFVASAIDLIHYIFGFSLTGISPMQENKKLVNHLAICL